VEAPQIRAFIDELPHRAEDLNAMGVAVLTLVGIVNDLTARVQELEAALAPKTPAARKAAGS
jgi:hypothetical protein